jgi:hypothetical protein
MAKTAKVRGCGGGRTKLLQNSVPPGAARSPQDLGCAPTAPEDGNAAQACSALKSTRYTPKSQCPGIFTTQKALYRRRLRTGPEVHEVDDALWQLVAPHTDCQPGRNSQNSQKFPEILRQDCNLFAGFLQVLCRADISEFLPAS